MRTRLNKMYSWACRNLGGCNGQWNHAWLESGPHNGRVMTCTRCGEQWQQYLHPSVAYTGIPGVIWELVKTGEQDTKPS